MIRPARLTDSERVLALRNDPESVFWSGKPPVSEEGHQIWFPAALGHILIVEDSEEVIGYGRLDDGRVSFAVETKIRGQGLGTAILLALEEKAKKEGCFRLSARVHPSNIASMRAFMKAGYHLSCMDGMFQIVEKWL